MKAICLVFGLAAVHVQNTTATKGLARRRRVVLGTRPHVAVLITQIKQPVKIKTTPLVEAVHGIHQHALLRQHKARAKEQRVAHGMTLVADTPIKVTVNLILALGILQIALLAFLTKALATRNRVVHGTG